MGRKTAIFAGGCFWCIETAFVGLKGVTKVTSGYTGGNVPNPTYEQVSSGTTGHFEAVEVEYDPEMVDYDALLDRFWLQIDPTDPDGQFSDKGPQYRTAIFYSDQEEKAAISRSKEELIQSKRFDKPIVTQILPAGEFYPAEDYHQEYYKKNPLRYHLYRMGSGRDRFLKEK
jgi:methionine-S-sulfoxide reductase